MKLDVSETLLETGGEKRCERVGGRNVGRRHFCEETFVLAHGKMDPGRTSSELKASRGHKSLLKIPSRPVGGAALASWTPSGGNGQMDQDIILNASYSEPTAALEMNNDHVHHGGVTVSDVERCSERSVTCSRAHWQSSDNPDQSFAPI